MKTAREKFEDEYVAVTVPADNKNGFKIKYIYYDEWFMWALPEGELLRKKQIVFMLCLLKTALFMALSTMSASVNAKLWVEVPATLAFCALIFELVGVFQFRFAKYRTTRQTYNDVHLKLRVAPLVYGGLIFTASVTAAVYIVFGAYSLKSILVAVGYAVCAAMSLFEHRVYKELKLKTEHNENFEKYKKNIAKYRPEEEET